MPDLTGLPIVTAQSLLTRVGIKFGEPKFQDVAIPAVGASGYAPVSAPGSGLAVAPSAVSTGVPMAAGATALPGAVLSQSPPAGYRVAVGSTVALTVAK